MRSPSYRVMPFATAVASPLPATRSALPETNMTSPPSLLADAAWAHASGTASATMATVGNQVRFIATDIARKRTKKSDGQHSCALRQADRARLQHAHRGAAGKGPQRLLGKIDRLLCRTSAAHLPRRHI